MDLDIALSPQKKTKKKVQGKLPYLHKRKQKRKYRGKNVFQYHYKFTFHQ